MPVKSASARLVRVGAGAAAGLRAVAVFLAIGGAIMPNLGFFVPDLGMRPARRGRLLTGAPRRLVRVEPARAYLVSSMRLSSAPYLAPYLSRTGCVAL